MPLNGYFDEDIAEIFDAIYPTRITPRVAVLLRVAVDSTRNGHATLTRNQLWDKYEIYGEGSGFNFPWINSTIKDARKALAKSNWPLTITTVHGLGWTFTHPKDWDWRNSRADGEPLCESGHQLEDQLQLQLQLF